jgi:DNA-binding transcriptional LysR family regulator
MDQLRAMRTFAEVAGRGGFAAAARALGIAPSVVTRLVAELEAALGARLLHRSTRQVALTPVGQRYLPRVQAILREVDDAAALAAHGQQALQGRVRLVAPALFAALQLMPRLGRLRAMHPQIVVDLAAGHGLDGADAAHDISLVVCGEGGLGGDFIAHRLASAQLRMCAAPAYLRRHGRPRHPRELAGHALLASAWPHLPRPLALHHATTRLGGGQKRRQSAGRMVDRKTGRNHEVTSLHGGLDRPIGRAGRAGRLRRRGWRRRAAGYHPSRGSLLGLDGRPPMGQRNDHGGTRER